MSHDLEALTEIGKRLDRIDQKIENKFELLHEKLVELTLDRARCATKCDQTSAAIQTLTAQSEENKTFRTQAKTIVAVFGALWLGLVAIVGILLEYVKRKP